MLTHKVGEEGLETYPHLPEFLWDSSDEEHHLSDPITLSVTWPAPPLQLEEVTQTKGGSDCHPASTQTEGGSGYHLSLKLLQDNNEVRVQMEYELIQQVQKLAKRYEHKWVKQAHRHARWWAWLLNQRDTTFQEVFCKQVWWRLSNYCLHASLWPCLSTTYVEWWLWPLSGMRASLLSLNYIPLHLILSLMAHWFQVSLGVWLLHQGLPL